MRFVSFIVPTLGRPTLEHTLKSIVNQTDPYWQALVVADCVDGFSLPVRDDRIYSVNLARRHGYGNCSGEVRNHGLTNACATWVGFVDDDDSVDPHYVEWMRSESADSDLVVFRMQVGPGGPLLPPDHNLQAGLVGISFAIRRDFQREKGLWFPNNPLEDWSLIDNACKMGARVKVSDQVAYYVRH